MSSLFHGSAILCAALLALAFPIQVLQAGPGGALIYEGFDYNTGALGGATGGTGFTGNWSTFNTAPVVLPSGLSWGSLNVAGNSVTNSNGGGAARDIGATSALDGAGLMGNGSTLWFSVVMKNAPAPLRMWTSTFLWARTASPITAQVGVWQKGGSAWWRGNRSVLP